MAGTLVGTDAADTFALTTEFEFDSLDGGAGFDTIYFPGVRQRVHVDLGLGFAQVGSAGQFYIAISSIERVVAGPDDDVIIGWKERSALIGGDGNDYIHDGAETDTLDGGNGNDTVIFAGQGSGGPDLIYGGLGNDTVSFEAQIAPVYADLRTGGGFLNTGLAALMTGIENLTGGKGNDLLVGNGGANALAGGGGTDQLFGFGGDDTFRGGTAVAGTQNQLFGGDGSDTVDYSAKSENLYVELRSPAGFLGEVLVDLMNSIENVIGGSCNDMLVGTDADANVLNGGPGSDVLFGMDGDDILIGGSNSAYPASSGWYDNIISGQYIGYNQLWGGPGLDTASYETTNFGIHADLRSGNSYTMGWVYTGGSALLDTYNSIENLTGSSAGDLLYGDDGPNRITGGLGRDVLFGRGGDDVFVFRTAAESLPWHRGASDSIGDFTSGQDKIDLSALRIDADLITILVSATATVLYADTELTSAGYEFAINFPAPNAIDLGDIIF